jgi:hypothetical protein
MISWAILVGINHQIRRGLKETSGIKDIIVVKNFEVDTGRPFSEFLAVKWGCGQF